MMDAEDGWTLVVVSSGFANVKTAKVRDRHSPAAYMVQVICQVRKQSCLRVRVRSDRAASSNNAAVMNKMCGRETNTKTVAIQSMCVLIVQAYYSLRPLL
jgi:hypothetical protein